MIFLSSMSELQKQQLIDYYKKLLGYVTEVKKVSTEPGNKQKLFDLSQDIFHTQAYFIGLMIDAEQSYKKRMNELVEAGSSNAAAETKAQSEEVYGLYKKSKLAYELAGEQCMLIKKLLGISEYEFRNS